MNEGKKGEKSLEEETSRGLPAVTESALSSLKELYSAKWGDHLEKVKRRMIIENPHLVKFIESQVGKYPVKQHNAMFEVILGTIAALEHQATINKNRQSRS
jgi:hypothetical protein